MELKRIRIGSVVLGLRFSKLQHTTVFRMMISNIADTAGVCSKFSNTNLQCLFLDFDDKLNIEGIWQLLDEIQHLYDMGDFYVFKTSEKHNNAICTDLIKPELVKNILLNNEKYIDSRFIFIYLRDGYNAMRITPKFHGNTKLRDISFIEIQKGNNEVHLKHYGLTMLLRDNFNIPLDLRYRYDDSNKNDLIIRRYETISW